MLRATGSYLGTGAERCGATDRDVAHSPAPVVPAGRARAIGVLLAVDRVRGRRGPPTSGMGTARTPMGRGRGGPGGSMEDRGLGSRARARPRRRPRTILPRPSARTILRAGTPRAGAAGFGASVPGAPPPSGREPLRGTPPCDRGPTALRPRREYHPASTFRAGRFVARRRRDLGPLRSPTLPPRVVVAGRPAVRRHEPSQGEVPPLARRLGLRASPHVDRASFDAARGGGRHPRPAPGRRSMDRRERALARGRSTRHLRRRRPRHPGRAGGVRRPRTDAPGGR